MDIEGQNNQANLIFHSSEENKQKFLLFSKKRLQRHLLAKRKTAATKANESTKLFQKGPSAIFTFTWRSI
jgi:hypothetical protein